MNASACPMEGSRMSPLGSLGFGSIANHHLRPLRGDGTTILLTTHYLDEPQHLADRVGVIAAGRLLAVETPERLGGREAHRARVRWHDGAGPHEEITQTPTSLVGELAARYGGEVPGLQVLRPSLEDVYLSLIESDAEVFADVDVAAPAWTARTPR
jgi:ABC-2 type transport system ATP-binding protein